MYSKSLADAAQLRKEFRDISYRIAKESYDDVAPDFSHLVSRMIDLSILSCYSKDSVFRPEAEWRHIIHRSDVTDPILYDVSHSSEFILQTIPGSISQIIIRMPTDLADIFESSLPKCYDVVRLGSTND